MSSSIKIFDDYTDVYTWNRNSTKRIRVNQGGTASSKTVSIIKSIVEDLIENPEWVATITATTWNQLSRGALRDFKRLLNQSKTLRHLLKNPALSEGPYIFRNGSILEFITSPRDAEEAKSGKRNILYINEGNKYKKAIAWELIIRSTDIVYIDHNPTAQYWVHEEIVPRPDCDFFVSCFMHNPYCPDTTKADILRHRALYLKYKKEGNKGKYIHHRNKWYVYGLGLTGTVEGVIYEDITWRFSFPVDTEVSAYVIDWGFKDDPLALALIGYKKPNRFYGKELIYEKGLMTPDLIKKMRALGIGYKDLIIVDTSNPDGIAQLRKAGYRNIIEAYKPANSRKSGVHALQGMEIHITYDSKNWAEEQKNYKFIEKNGIFTDEPKDGDDHLFDCLRYFYQTIFTGKKRGRTSNRRVKN